MVRFACAASPNRMPRKPRPNFTGGGLAANNGNYVFVQAPANATAFAINPATLTVSGSKTYDGTTSFVLGNLTTPSWTR
jgi:hypothetical protein